MPKQSLGANSRTVEGATYVRVELFLAGDCPEGLSHAECVKKGDAEGTYHFQDWVLNMQCSACGAEDFMAIEGVKFPNEKGHALLCPMCNGVLDKY